MDFISPNVATLTPSLTLAVTNRAKEMKANGEQVFGLAGGEPDKDTPENIKQAAIKALENGATKYTPSVGLPQLRQAIADKLGMDFEISDMEFDAIIPAIQNGKASIGMAGMTVTPDREKNVSFSQTYATGVQVIIVPEGSDITSADDLEGKKIGVQQGTTGDLYCSDTPENGGFGEDAVTRYSKGSDAVMALLSGKVDCVVIDNEPAKAFVEANEGLKILDTAYVEEEYAIAVAKDNTELLEKVDAALGELKEDGTVQSIIDKYITAE